MGRALTGPYRPLLPGEPCRQCGETKRRPDGRCAACRRLSRRRWQGAHPDLHAQYKREDHERHRDMRLRHTRAWNRRVKAEVMAAYGGCCACCGEARLEFLTIDHVNNDGKAHRHEIGKVRIYRWLRANGYPQDGRFRCLCWNCNAARQYYRECPHVHDRNATTSEEPPNG